MESVLRIAADHPAYAGHFPGRPILPGVALLAEVMHEIERATGRGAKHWTLASAKFLQPVTPGMPLTLVQTASATGGIRFEVRSAAGVVAAGSLAPSGAA
jgi:3-hydroxymyristoyl/3-hydroxydecanoyl-(acyl carrier protein) dehydratase